MWPLFRRVIFNINKIKKYKMIKIFRTVNTAFKNLIIAIVKSMSNSISPDEIKCMLEGLKWK